MGEVSVVKVSHSGTIVASGDTTKNIYLWDSSTKEIVNNRFVFHSAKVFDIAWSNDDLALVSSSLDCSVILWNVPEKSRTKVLSDVDIDAVLAVSFVNDDKQFLFAGHSCGIRKFGI
jgi:WD40 repeat protein